MYAILAKNEQLMQSFDMVRIFKHIARKMGAKNVDQFEVKQAPDQQAQQQAQAGNLIPAEQIGEMGGFGL